MSQKDKTFGLSSENHVQLRKLNKKSFCWQEMSALIQFQVLALQKS